MGADLNKVYTSKDLAPGKSIIFAATGVTEGSLMKGVRFFGDGTRTTSLIMQTDPHRIRFIDSIHVSNANSIGAKIRFF
jgi:fructose-1,6-bisphosphatase/sedoheptulose 1,7-bisphosphatase-like protein